MMLVHCKMLITCTVADPRDARYARLGPISFIGQKCYQIAHLPQPSLPHSKTLDPPLTASKPMISFLEGINQDSLTVWRICTVLEMSCTCTHIKIRRRVERCCYEPFTLSDCENENQTFL